LKIKPAQYADPAVSWDGKYIYYAHKKSLNEDDYHIYEYDPATDNVRQITFGKGFVDYEPACLPNGDIIFSSTRCVQTVDCWWTEVSNIYRCNRDGKFLRRLGFDQVHTVSPSVLDDGRIIYTRWIIMTAVRYLLRDFSR
jgi:Tol biopolymer transport system component